MSPFASPSVRILSVLAAAALVLAFTLALTMTPGTTLAQLITRWSPGGVAGLESFSQRNLPDWTWSRVMAPMLMRPCWLMPVDFALIFAGIAATIAIRRARPAERKRG